MTACRFKTTRLRSLLWLLTALFGLRVVGQALVEFLQVGFLPPSQEWFSGVIPYRELLPCQILILALQIKIDIDFTRQSGWSYRPRRVAGRWLLAFGAIYLTAMILRYAIRMELYPDQRWTGGAIPIVFHWVLSSYVLLLGYHHWQHGRAGQAEMPRAIA